MDDDESIRMHLLRMLTTRQGAVQALPDYGLPDLNDLSLSRAEVVLQCCAAIEECIAKYEPRLAGARVRYAPLDDGLFAMGFQIEGMRVEAGGSLVPWSWSVVMDGEQFRSAG